MPSSSGCKRLCGCPFALVASAPPDGPINSASADSHTCLLTRADELNASILPSATPDRPPPGEPGGSHKLTDFLATLVTYPALYIFATAASSGSGSTAPDEPGGGVGGAADGKVRRVRHDAYCIAPRSPFAASSPGLGAKARARGQSAAGAQGPGTLTTLPPPPPSQHLRLGALSLLSLLLKPAPPPLPPSRPSSPCTPPDSSWPAPATPSRGWPSASPAPPLPPHSQRASTTSSTTKGTRGSSSSSKGCRHCCPSRPSAAAVSVAAAAR